MWPPRMDALSPRQLRLIELAEHAEAYVREQQRAQQQGGSVTRRHHDVASSRREWAQAWQ